MPTSSATLLLDAAHFATEADVENLRKLVGSSDGALDQELVLRIVLTYLPESSDPDVYTGFIADLDAGNLSVLDDSAAPSRSGKTTNEEEATHKALELRLLPLELADQQFNDTSDSLTKFLVHRAHRIESETGSLLLVQRLIEPFVNSKPNLQLWMASILLPLLRLEYEYYPVDHSTGESGPYTLHGIEALTEGNGLKSLLTDISGRKSSPADHDWAKAIRGIVGPRAIGTFKKRIKRRRESLISEVANEEGSVSAPSADSRWAQINEWILGYAQDNLYAAIQLVRHWDGPGDVDFGGWYDSHEFDSRESKSRYAQTALALLYLSREGTIEPQWEELSSILTKAAALANIEALNELQLSDVYLSSYSIDDEYLSSITRMHILQEELLNASNTLTHPSISSLELSNVILSSAHVLSTLGEVVGPDSILALSLYGFEADQRTKLQNTLHSLAQSSHNDELWRQIRQKVLWLRNWNAASPGSSATRHGVFCRLSFVEVELELIKAMVTNTRFNLVKEIYASQGNGQGPSAEQVQKAVLDVAYSFYDNASNGNKTRGGIRKASDIITAFESHFPNSKQISQARSLIQATHALSFYSLTLQHGVIFKPVNIRVHAEPLSLIGKVLDQNSKSYTHLDDLLGIGRNLVQAGLVKGHEEYQSSNSQSEQGTLVMVERRIIAQAIEVALKQDDFDTAYSYIISRLSTSTDMPRNGESQLSQPEDSVLWQAAYQAGRYRPKRGSDTSDLRNVEQRMELLSQALLLTPSSSIQEVLATWLVCEEELKASLAQENEEEEQWNIEGDKHLPGGFTGDDVVPTFQKPRNATRSAIDEEAPMGLFEVARGAASAFSKSAFPLRGQAANSTGSYAAQSSPSAGRQSFEDHEGNERVRKRDMVSNMVTGGLASGIGWVIGAPPKE